MAQRLGFVLISALLLALVPARASAQAQPGGKTAPDTKYSCKADAQVGTVFTEVGPKLGKLILLDDGINPTHPVGVALEQVEAGVAFDRILQKNGWTTKEWKAGAQEVVLVRVQAPVLVESADPAKLAEAFKRWQARVPALADCTSHADLGKKVLVIEGPKDHVDIAVALLKGQDTAPAAADLPQVKRIPLRFARVGKEPTYALDGTKTDSEGIESAILSLLQKSKDAADAAHGGVLPSIFADPRTNSIIIVDLPATIARIEQIITAMDVPVPLVEIECRLVLTDHVTGTSLGVRMGGIHGKGATHNSATVVSGPIGTDDPNLATAPTMTRSLTEASEGSNLFVNGPAKLLTGETGFGAVALALDQLAPKLRLDLEISAIELQNKGRTISAPHIVTLESQEAAIQVGEDVRVPLTGNQFDVGTLQSIPTGVILRVTPYVVKDQHTGRIWIRMHIYMEQSEVNTIDDSGAIRLERTACTTQVLVEDGFPAVISGLLADQRNTSRTQVPFLGKIPLLGLLFQQNARGQTSSELTVCVIPRVVGRPDPWGGTAGTGFEASPEKRGSDRDTFNRTDRELPHNLEPPK